MRWTVWLFLSWIFITIVPMSAWCQTRDGRDVSGRLIFDRAAASCDTITVELEVVEMQPIASTYTDSVCAFKFSKVAPGSYNIHVKIDGYQEVRVPVEVDSRFGANGSPNILMVSVPGRTAQGPAKSSSPATVDVSEVLEQYPRKAVSLFKKALENRKKKRTAEAINQLESALRIAPDFYHAHSVLGLLYKDSGRPDKAEEHFLRAHEINRSSADPLINLGGLYLQEDQPELAAKASEEAVEKNDRSGPALFNLGLSLYRIAQFDRAETVLLKVLQVAPKMFQVRLALANVYLKLSRFGNVMDQLNAYLAENPQGEARDQVERLRSQLLKRQDPL